ncbi:MAG: aspartyl protease [Cyanobacteria bacterium J06621_15]
MIQGVFGKNGELFFEISLIAADGSDLIENALFDTGCTDWLVMNVQDIECLEWTFLREQKRQTAKGLGDFYFYQGTVIFNNQELTIPALGGEEINEILIGLPWLESRRLIVDRKANILSINNEQLSMNN